MLKMKKNSVSLLVHLLLFCVLGVHAQQKLTISMDDLSPCLGSWEGNLTYLDYSSGKPFSMPAHVEITRLSGKQALVFVNNYPNEKHANTSDTLVLSPDGRYLGKGEVKSKKRLTNGDWEIYTEILGADGNENKKALLRTTFTFGEKTLQKRKDIQFEGETTWIKRHEYVYVLKSR